MNKQLFYSINTPEGHIYLNNDYIDMLYDYYVTGGNYFNYKVNITKEEFISIITPLNDTLKEIYNEE